MVLLIKNSPLADKDIQTALETLQVSLRQSDDKFKDGVVSLCDTRKIINEKS